MPAGRRATLIFQPWMPRASATSSRASQTRWTWLPCTENWQMRKTSLSQPCTKAYLSTFAGPGPRKRGSPAIRRTVTWTGKRDASDGRLRCGTRGRGATRLRPAPRRLPPRRVRNAISVWQLLVRLAIV